MASSVTILNVSHVVTFSYSILMISCMLKRNMYVTWPEGDCCILMWQAELQRRWRNTNNAQKKNVFFSWVMHFKTWFHL